MKRSFIYLNILIFFFIFLRVEFIFSQEIFDNTSDESQSLSSELNEQFLDLNSKFDETINQLNNKKNNINENQLNIIKSKNTLLLLSDLPLTSDEKSQILSEIENNLFNQDSIYNESLQEQLNIIKSIKDEYTILSDQKKFSQNQNSIETKLENLYINFLNLENKIEKDLKQAELEEYEIIDNKIVKIKEFLKNPELENNIQNINNIKDILKEAEFEKAKLNNRNLDFSNNKISIIDEDINLILPRLSFNDDIEVSETKLNEKIETIKANVSSLKSQLQNSNIEFKENNAALKEVYSSLKTLNKSLRYGEYLITTEGLLVSFAQEEEKIKRKILELEDKKQVINNLINDLDKEIKIKNDEVLKTFNQTKELKEAKLKINTKIKRINVEVTDLKIFHEKSQDRLFDNNQIIEMNTQDLESLYKSPRMGIYIVTDEGSLLSFDDEEKRILNQIIELEKNNGIIKNQILNLENKIQSKAKELEIAKENSLKDLKNDLNQKKVFQAILELQSELESKIIDAEKKLKKARLEGDLMMITEALENKVLIETKLSVGRSEFAKSKNLEQQKLLEYDRDLKISNPNIQFDERNNIQSQFLDALKAIDLENKKLDIKLNSLLNKSRLRHSEEIMLAKLNQFEKDLRQAREEGDLNRINDALKNKIGAESDIKITRLEIEIGKNKEEEKLLEYERDFKLSNSKLENEQRTAIENQYSKYINKLDMMNKGLENIITLFDKLVDLKEEEDLLLAKLNQTEKALNQAREEGDVDRINEILKNKNEAESDLKVTRFEIEIGKNKEEEKLLEYERDYNLSSSSLDVDQRRNIHKVYSETKKNLAIINNNLSNSIQNVKNDKKRIQNQIELNKAEKKLSEARKEGNLDKINEALENLNSMENKLQEIETEIAEFDINKISEFQSTTFNQVLNKSTKTNEKRNISSSKEERKVFMKSGQVYSSEYNRIFDGPSPREKEALKKRILRGVSKNVNVLSNNLLIFNNGELIIIPMQDIVGRSDQQLTSIINTAFNPKLTLYEIRDKVKEEIKTDKSKKDSNDKNVNDQKTSLDESDELNINNSVSIDNIKSEAQKEIKVAIKIEVNKAKEVASLAQAEADDAARELVEAKIAAEKAAKELAEAKVSEAKEAAAKEAYDKAIEALDAAKKTAVEKAAAAAKAATNAAVEKALAESADLALTAAELASDAKEAAKNQAKAHYESLLDLAPTAASRVAAYNDYLAKNEDWKEAVADEESKDDAFDDATEKADEAKTVSDNAAKESDEANAVKEKAEKDALEKKKLCATC